MNGTVKSIFCLARMIAQEYIPSDLRFLIIHTRRCTYLQTSQEPSPAEFLSKKLAPD